ncbi:hypothetical protein CR513_53279, partial [Mucuna pruriens]
KLRFKWDGPFVITNVFPYGVVELKDENTNNTFQVNGHQIKLFHEGPTPIVGDMETISLMESALPDNKIVSRYKPKPKNHIQHQPKGLGKLWNCFESGSRSSVEETPGDIQTHFTVLSPTFNPGHVTSRKESPGDHNYMCRRRGQSRSGSAGYMGGQAKDIWPIKKSLDLGAAIPAISTPSQTGRLYIQ